MSMVESGGSFHPRFYLCVEVWLPGSYLLGRCVSFQSHKARPTVWHLGCERALHFSFWVLLLLSSVCPSVHLYWGIGQSLALCPAWHGEQSCCFLSGDKQHSPILLLSVPSVDLLLSSYLKPAFPQGQVIFYTVPEALENHPRPKRSLPSSERFPVSLIYHLSYAALNHLFGAFCLRAWLALRAEIISYSSLYPPHCLA